MRSIGIMLVSFTWRVNAAGWRGGSRCFLANRSSQSRQYSRFARTASRPPTRNPTQSETGLRRVRLAGDDRARTVVDDRAPGAAAVHAGRLRVAGRALQG